MKVDNIIYSLFILLSLIVGCKKEDEIGQTIKVIADKNIYNTQEKISITISNQLCDTAYHFKCDNHDLRLSYIVKKESNIWIEEEYPLLCTQKGPSGFWGKINPEQIKNDSLKIDSQGDYKLKYTFIIDLDTTYYESNEFKIVD